MTLAQATSYVPDGWTSDRFNEWVTRHDPNGTIEIVLVTLLCVTVLYGFLRHRSVAWAWIKKNYSSWREGRKVRREEKIRQQRGACAALETWLDHEVDEGDMDPRTANQWRDAFSKLLPDMKPKRDVKGGIKLRLRSPFYREPVPLPDQASVTGQSAPTGKFK